MKPRISLETLCLSALELWLNRDFGHQFPGTFIELGTVAKHQWWDLKFKIKNKYLPSLNQTSDLGASNLFSFDQNITWDAPEGHALRALHILVKMNWASAHLFHYIHVNSPLTGQLQLQEIYAYELTQTILNIDQKLAWERLTSTIFTFYFLY